MSAIHPYFPSRAAEKVEPERHRFRLWLRRHRRAAKSKPLGALLQGYGGNISFSAAYRVAVAEGIYGVRRNRSRYAAFWDTINWDLPDSVLERIWGVARGNLRQRRLRMGVGGPTFALPAASANQRFIHAVARERKHSTMYRGPRPR